MVKFRTFTSKKSEVPLVAVGAFSCNSSVDKMMDSFVTIHQGDSKMMWQQETYCHLSVAAGAVTVLFKEVLNVVS